MSRDLGKQPRSPHAASTAAGEATSPGRVESPAPEGAPPARPSSKPMKLSELVQSEMYEDGSAAACWATFRELVDPEVVARFTVEGDPPSKSRPRFTSKNSKVRAYTPDKVTQAEQTIGWLFRKTRPDWGTPDSKGVFGVMCLFFTKNNQRRDVDNMIKLVFDACNKLVWQDDVQVSEVTGRVVRNTPDPRTEVLIYRTWPTSEPASYERACDQCGATFKAYRAWGNRRFCSKSCASSYLWAQRSKPCPVCGEAFHEKPSQPQEFCSRRCRSLGTLVDLMCTECDAPFQRFRSQVRRGANVFCNDQCHARFWRKRRAAAARGVCVVCGAATSKKSYRRCNACKIAGREAGGDS